MRTTVIIVAALGLSACSTTPPMQSALAPLAGQPVQLVFDRLGPPSSATPAGTDTVYRWYSSKPVHGAASRGTLMASAPGSQNGESSGLYPGPAVPYTCDVSIVADSEGRIKDSQFGEQTGGCRETAGKLRQLALAD
jgi:hypothetical protein